MKNKIDGIQISAITASLPKNIVSIDEYKDFFGEKKINRIKKSTGVEEVRVVDAEMTASDLCYDAAQRLFSEGNINKNEIDAIIFASISPDYKAPATAIILQDRLGLRKEVVAMDLTFGCSAYIYGLYQACLLIKAGGCKKVLLCNGDTQSKMVNDRDRSMKMLVGDAGTATIVEQGNDEVVFVLGCDGSGYGDLIIKGGGMRYPSSEDTRMDSEDADGNIRNQENLYMNGMEVMKFALDTVPNIINELLNEIHINQDAVSLFAMHQPNKMILQALCLRLGISEERMPIGLQKTGNTASASIPLLLTMLKAANYNFSESENIVACGFGIGLSYGCANLNLTKTLILPVSDI